MLDTQTVAQPVNRRRFLQRLGVGAAGVITASGIASGLPTPAEATQHWTHPRRRRRTTTIRQVAVYHDASAQQLFELYTTSASHSAATHAASGQVRWVDPDTGEEAPVAQVGLSMEGFYLPDGQPGLTTQVIALEPGRRITQRWINFAWQLATSATPSDRPSILDLQFRDNTAGAELVLTQARLPTYEIDLSPSPFNPNGEQGPLSEIVRVHWELLYWQPIRRYLLDRES